MKNYNRLVLLASAAFSYLFYRENAGINFLVFDILIMLLFIIRQPELLRSGTWWWAAALTTLSGTGILITSSVLAVFSNIFSLLLLSAFSSPSRNSAVIAFFMAAFSVATAGLRITEKIFYPSAGTQNRSGKILKNLLVAGIITAISIIFFMLYRSANPLFAANTDWISFDFISFGWLIFTAIGVVICFGLFNYQSIRWVDAWEISSAGTGYPEPEEERLKLEKSAATWLFAVLNGMLILLNIGDINSLLLGGVLPEGVTHTDFVHHGVSNAILSIVLACGIIMYVYRYKPAVIKTSFLQWLILLWIMQTMIMLISTAGRNNMYIEAFGLTLKRIGVFYWLLAAAIGLVLMAVSIIRNRGNWFLIRSNFSVWITMIAFSSLVRWDVMVVQYNFTHREPCQQDFAYIYDLSDAVIPQVHDYMLQADEAKLNRCGMGTGHIRKLLEHKIRSYLGNYTNDWQSWDAVDLQVVKTIQQYNNEK